MKTTSFFTFLIFFILTFSCNEPELYPEDCRGYYAGAFKKGYSFAEGSYQDYGDYAIFVREEATDTLTGKSHLNTSLVFTYIDEYCIEKNMLWIRNIRNIIIKDTVQLNYSYLGVSLDFPTSVFYVVDGNSGIEYYHLVESIDNWLVIESVNSDTTRIEGKFSASFVTSDEKFLKGERERWDDPNRPDTLHFTNGEFRAEFIN